MIGSGEKWNMSEDGRVQMTQITENLWQQRYTKLFYTILYIILAYIEIESSSKVIRMFFIKDNAIASIIVHYRDIFLIDNQFIEIKISRRRNEINPGDLCMREKNNYIVESYYCYSRLWGSFYFPRTVNDACEDIAKYEI